MAMTASKSSYYHPDAPTVFGKDRRCSRGFKCLTYEETGRWGEPEVGKVRSTRAPLVKGDGDSPEVVLCNLCERARLDAYEPEPVHEFCGVEKKGKSTRYKLPNLARIREAQRHTRYSLAQEAGVDDGTIKRAEEGEWVGTNPTKKLAAALGVSVGELREGSGEAPLRSEAKGEG